MEFENIDANEGNKKATLALGAVIVTVIALAIITYVFFYNTNPTYDNSEVEEIAQIAQEQTIDAEDANALANQSVNPQNTPANPQNVELLPDSANANTAIKDSAPNVISANAGANAGANRNFAESSAIEFLPDSAVNKPSTITSLKYTIKPNDMDIFSCTNFKNGKWAMPKNCAREIASAVQRLIDNNTELIALEVSGIVDNNPFSGPSAELKQEGLASFRAREGIIAIMRSFSNVAAFEGPSMQMPNKRGFQVKAYYLQK